MASSISDQHGSGANVGDDEERIGGNGGGSMGQEVLMVHLNTSLPLVLPLLKNNEPISSEPDKLHCHPSHSSEATTMYRRRP